MRVPPVGNLTVALIRQARFETVSDLIRQPHAVDRCVFETQGYRGHTSRIIDDRVRLSDEAYAFDDGSCALSGVKQSQARDDPPQGSVLESPRPAEPSAKTITPVVGSPALAGLGVSLIVPGTLLDVVA